MCHTSPRPIRRAGCPILALGGVLLGVGLTLVNAGHHAATPAAPADPPRADPRLILRPRTVPITAALPSDLRLSGAYAPAYPGRNVFDLTVRQGAAPLGTRARITLSATMLGMAMPPIRAILRAGGQRYRGVLALPMFGTYRVAVVVSAPPAHVTGTMTVTLPLPER